MTFGIDLIFTSNDREPELLGISRRTLQNKIKEYGL
jgi:DNA-binding protein Fis